MHTLSSIEVEVFLRLCKKIDSVVSRKAAQLLVERDPEFLSLKLDPRDYLSAADFDRDYLISKFLSKWEGFDKKYFNIDTKSVAIDGWTAAEKKCGETNRYLRYHAGTNYKTFPAREVLIFAREKIRDIIGDFPVLTTILDKCEWTNGATTDTKFGTPLAQKMSKPIAVSGSALPYLRACIESDPTWSSCFIGRLPDGPCSLLHAYQIREFNRFLTVPKTAKTDRCIATEPAGNSFLQRGVGIYMREKLRRHGIRLRHQEDNQDAARRAYSESLATLDLRAASDTISQEVICALLPIEWYLFLDALRSRNTRILGVSVKLEKFSSMGNAFTFELETLIFYSIAYAVCKIRGGSLNKVKVYGDDIICESKYAAHVISALNEFGFDINRDKSYTEGPFYESCGVHYFTGLNVTPVYQKMNVSNLQEQIRLYNRIYRWGCANAGTRWSAVSSSIRYLRKLFNINYESVYNARIPAIPNGVTGDDGFLVDPDWLPRYDNNRGYYCSVYVFRPTNRKTRCEDALLAYKYRHRKFSNIGRKGQALDSTKSGTWQRKKRWIHNWSNLEQDSEIAILPDLLP